MKRSTCNAGDQFTARLQMKGFRYRAAMVTLTYRDVHGWKGRHVSDYLQNVRKWLKRRGFPLLYVWVAELQRRGAVHYHVVMWLPRGLTLPKADACGWWPHGYSRMEWARKPVGYLVKYSSKAECLESFPKGLRMHGRGGLERAERRVVSWWNLPRYVRTEFLPVGSWVVRALGGGWVNRETGEWMAALQGLSSIGAPSAHPS